MKKFLLGLVLCMLLALTGSALAQEGAFLLVSLPEDAQMVEDVHFDDGDFVQTYQLSGGAYVQLLRYARMSMTLDELIASDWAGALGVRSLNLPQIGGFQTEGVRFTYEQSGQDTLVVSLVLVSFGDGTLMFQAVYPEKLGEAQIEAGVSRMIDSMNVMNASENNEVG